MNDPNGLVYENGVYHLFYQYNPLGNTWGNMSWGHATSTDLVHWQEQPLAIPNDAEEDIFSGSVVADAGNTSGFGSDQNPPLVAIYTSAYKAGPHNGLQAQSLAYSTDHGQTWTKYANNPVLDRGSANFRDPKVFRYTGAAGSYWVMTAVEATAHQVVLYKSTDLKTWTHLSDFGPANATGGVWETPDLFPLAVDGDSSRTKWVLTVGINPGAISGGSGGQYFVGDFDGTTFTSDQAGYTPPSGSGLQNFEGGSFGSWTSTGTAFGTGPATGAVDGQQTVSGFLGTGFANSFHGADATTGTLTSPEFTITNPHLNFLVGGGKHPYVPGSDNNGAAPAGDVLASFDGSGYDDWTSTGMAFGTAPATGALPGQLAVSGYLGSGLVDSFVGGDSATGVLTSPSFPITRDHLDFLIGGGNHPSDSPDPTAVELVVNGQVVASATGRNSETLNWTSWDVSAYRGQNATIRVVDENTGGWGHILADQFVQSDQAVSTFEDFESGSLPGWTGTGDLAGIAPHNESLPGQQGQAALDTCVGACDAAQGTLTSPVFTIGSDYIDFLIAGGNHPLSSPKPTVVNLLVGGKVVESATGNNSANLDWTSWNVASLRGQQAQIQIVDASDSGSWGHIIVDDFVFSNHAAAPYDHQTAVDLIVDGKIVKSTTGADSESMDWASWDVSSLIGQKAQIRLVDQNTGGWGHILADEFTQSDTAAIDSTHRANWVDYGRDFYAGNSFNDAPDGKRIMIGWMNNWDYGNDIPTTPWRSAMSLPREVALQTVDGHLRLVQQPVAQLSGIEEPTRAFAMPAGDIAAGTTVVPTTTGTAVVKVDLTISQGTASQFGVIVRRAADGSEGTPITYDTATGMLSLDRRASGDVGFNASFASVEQTPVSLADGKLHLQLYLDTSSVEAFAQGGIRTITDQVFPKASSTGIALTATGGTAHLDSLTVTPLQDAMWGADQSIAFPAPADVTFGDPDIALSATASSRLPVTFTASGSCTIVNGAAHPTAAGSCTVTAHQQGDASYNPAPDVTRTVTIAPWTFTGFASPVASGAGAVTVINGGSTVPLKFTATVRGAAITDAAVLQGSIAVTPVSCTSGEATGAATTVPSTGATALRYDPVAQQWIANWRTPQASGQCFAVALTTADGSTLRAGFRTK
ncbi:GH32 C-terminal domain-containing protein [Microbacterium panaciterrae]|uniref:Glycosyl hydrolase family 32 n=1 Tax=Microbacterium panaciterrae TaxID=985759 RepID=A0ABP8PKH4_9MICO